MDYMQRIYDNIIKSKNDGLWKIECSIKPDNNILKILDEFFLSKTDYANHTDFLDCDCGYKISNSFFDLIKLPNNYFKTIITYCIDKNYIQPNNFFEHKLCKKIFTVLLTNDIIDIVLWLIENYISSETLNNFLYDYNNEKSSNEPIENNEYRRDYFSLLQIFYNNQFYDEYYIPVILETFRQKQFDFANVSKSCCRSLLVSAITNLDLYSVRYLYEAGCEFDEQCYTQLMFILRRKLGNLQDESEMPETYLNACESKLYRELLHDDDALITFFQPHLLNRMEKDDNPVNINICKHIDEYVTKKFSHMNYFNRIKKTMIEKVSSYFYRSYLVPNEDTLQMVYEIFEYVINIGKIDLDFKCNLKQQDNYYIKYKFQLENPILLNGYLHGSKPIRLIFPEYHEKFVKLLTKI